MKSTLVFSFWISMFMWLCSSVNAANEPLNLYLDADLSNAVSSSTAIEQGIRTALSEVNDTVAGHIIHLVKLDHRGNSRRSLDNIKQFLADDHALAVFAGLHSPPLLANKKFINENSVLVLNPWAAAGPITRYNDGENWIFRLSVDDSKAGYVIVEHAVKARGIKNPALLLEDTGWGKSNKNTMTKALNNYDLSPANIFWFNWGIKETAARIMLRDIFNTGADSVLFVGNAPEGKVFAKAMAGLPESKLPIFSHWGITGGDFPLVIGPDTRKKIDLTFLQTSFSFVSMPNDTFGKKVFKQAAQLFPNAISSVADIKAPTGFIHAYDLTKILIAAIDKVGLSGKIKEDRINIRAALEQLETPIKGLIKTYIKPFTRFGQNHPDAHEALSIDDFTMARYGENNEIILIPDMR